MNSSRQERSVAPSATHDAFYDYYAEESLRPEVQKRFSAQRDALLRLVGPSDGAALDVVDLGCGAGAASLLWSDVGHRVFGVDVSEKLIGLATRRAAEREADVHFTVGSAHELPLPDGCADICVAPELLEHVPQWEACVGEIARVLRPGGVAFLSTTNTLSPRQREFNLPLFGWYPAPIKARYIELSKTTRPDLANYATFPAVNWFNYYSLRRALRRHGFDRFWSRFDIMAKMNPSRGKRVAARIVNASFLGRLAGQILTEGTQIYARKAAD